MEALQGQKLHEHDVQFAEVHFARQKASGSNYLTHSFEGVCAGFIKAYYSDIAFNTVKEAADQLAGVGCRTAGQCNQRSCVVECRVQLLQSNAITNAVQWY